MNANNSNRRDFKIETGAIKFINNIYSGLCNIQKCSIGMGPEEDKKIKIKEFT